MDRHQARRAATVSLLAAGLTGDALDYGCGWGDLTARLAPQFQQIRGVDADPERVAFAAAEHAPVSFAPCRPDGLDLPAASVDVVFSTVVLHFVPDADAYLAECRRVTRPTGSLVIMIQNPDSFWMRLRGALGRPVDGPGWGGRSRKDLLAMLARHGFVAEREAGFYDPPFDRLRTPGDALLGVLNGIGHLLRLDGFWSYVGYRCRRAG